MQQNRNSFKFCIKAKNLAETCRIKTGVSANNHGLHDYIIL